jgi:streptomycin 6-kinase
VSVERTFELPELVYQRLLADGREDWLERLPALVAGLERDWGFETGRVFSGGSEALVLEATLAGGAPAILKILTPREDDFSRHEVVALRLAGGVGCAKLLRDDPNRGAMLLERLGAPLADLGLSQEARLAILTDAAQRVWLPAAGAGLPTGAEKGRWLRDYISQQWESLGRPCSERAVALAMDCLERRIAAHDDARSVLVHGDIHEGNTLRAGDSYKLIDPDGLLAEPEYDLGVIIRSAPVASSEESRALAAWVATRTGRDATATWEWSVAERLTTGLVCLRVNWLAFGQRMLAAADAVAAG